MIDNTIYGLVNTTINSFDFTFCAIINIATYVIIMLLNDTKLKSKLSTWWKRGIFLIVSLILGSIYYTLGSDHKVLINSIILAPVSWSWIFKPICARLRIDYKERVKDSIDVSVKI